MGLSALHQLAEQHHGIVRRDAAEAVGVSRSAWYRLIEAGHLEAVAPNVCRIPGSPPTREQAIAAAVAAVEPGAMASHRTAAYLLGIPRDDDGPIEVLIVDRPRAPKLDGVIVHRPRDDRDLTPVLCHGIATTNILRTLCDLAAVDPGGLSAAVGYVVTKRLASADAIAAVAKRHGRPGRTGIPALREALAGWMIQGQPPDSLLERTMARLLDRFDIGPWQFHARIAGFEVDFWLVDTPIVLECDGWEHHGRTQNQFARGVERDGELIAAGYLPVHFTYGEIVRTPAKVAARIGNARERWAARG